LTRSLYTAIVAEKIRPRRVLIVGTGKTARALAHAIKLHEWAGMAVGGFASINATEAANQVERPAPYLGIVDTISELVTAHNIDTVCIAVCDEYESAVNRLVQDLRLVPVDIYLVPDVMSLQLYQATAVTTGSSETKLLLTPNESGILTSELPQLHLITIRGPVLSRRQYIVKRCVDIFLSGTLILLTLPVMVLVAIAIKLDSPGPILFVQKRVGKNARLFNIYKFRSMVADAEQYQQNASITGEPEKKIHKIANDPRVTRVGAFIRCTSLDELPQLFNVIKGDMSLVGPRPELPQLVKDYALWQFRRLSVPQGITGWWQVNGRSNKIMHLNTEYDIYYVDHYSLLLDIWIMMRTLPTVLKRRGAF
jgi:exopolysaccharide biosynthesis polyprenyl glycosylphosphotransferase